MAWQDWVIFKRRSQHTEESVRYEQRDPAQGAASGLFAVAFDTGKVAWSLTDKNIVAARGKTLILAGQGPVIKADIDELMAGYAKYWKDGKNLGHDENIAPSGVDYTNSGPGKLIPNPAWMSPLPYQQWQADVGRVFVLLCAGDTILAGGRGTVSAIDFQTGEVLWQKTDRRRGAGHLRRRRAVHRQFDGRQAVLLWRRRGRFRPKDHAPHSSSRPSAQRTPSVGRRTFSRPAASGPDTR